MRGVLKGRASRPPSAPAGPSARGRGRAAGLLARRRAALAVCLAAGAAGCGMPGASSVGASYLTAMRVPAGRNPVIGHWGADVGLASWSDGAADSVALGAFAYHDEHGELPCGLFASFDFALAAFARSRAWRGSERPLFPILRPLLGMWWWVESPENTGVLTGIRAGVGKVVADGAASGSVLVEYCAYRLENTAHSEATVIQAVTVSYRWRQ